MITHVVLMRFKPENRTENLAEARTRLLSMAGRVESLRSIEVGLNAVAGERALDLALITRFDDLAGLSAYATHPVHVAVKNFLQTVLDGSFVVDYETPA